MSACDLTWRSDKTVAWPMKKLGHALLGASEGAMLYYLARDWCSGLGQIVEAGSFLGASASLLGKGLADNPNRNEAVRIHCFDLWEAKFGGLAHFIRNRIDPTFKDGADFMHIFRRQTKEFSNLIATHKCNFEDASWIGSDIELLFIDIAKTPSLNRVILERFLPFVIAGDGLMVQQDFHNPDNPWIQTSLGYLINHFEILEPRADDSALFRVKNTISAEDLSEAGRYEDLTYDERIDRLERLIAAFRSEDFGERYLELIRARLVIEAGHVTQGLEILNAAQQRFSQHLGPEDFFWERRIDKVRTSRYADN